MERNSKAFFLKSETREGCLFSPNLFNIIFGSLSSRNNVTERDQGDYSGKEKVKVPLLVDDTILYISDLQNSTRKLLHFQHSGWIQNQLTKIHTTDKQTEKESGRQHFPQLASNNIKFLEVTLSKQVKDLYNKNSETLKKENEDDIRRWKHLPCSWIGRITIVKMAILPMTIYRYNSISIKSPTQLFTYLRTFIVSHENLHTKSQDS